MSFYYLFITLFYILFLGQERFFWKENIYFMNKSSRPFMFSGIQKRLILFTNKNSYRESI